MKDIKNIIFDLGGVLLNIDYKQTSEAMKKLGIQAFDEMYTQVKANQLFETLEAGGVSEEDFFQEIHGYCNPPATREQVQTAWNAILLDFRISSLAELERLKGKYRLFLLSNTNSIHLTEFSKRLKDITGKESLDDYFEKAYYSHDIKMRKPNPEIYRWVLKDGDMIAEETLFIDDSLPNILGAEEVGIKTHHLLPGEKIEDLNL